MHSKSDKRLENYGTSLLNLYENIRIYFRIEPKSAHWIGWERGPVAYSCEYSIKFHGSTKSSILFSPVEQVFVLQELPCTMELIIST